MKNFRHQIIEFLQNLELIINEKSSFINTADKGLTFLGLRIFRSVIRIRQQNLKRSMKNI